MNEWKRRLVNGSVVDITSIMRKLSPVYEMEMFATLKSAKYSDGKCNRFFLLILPVSLELIILFVIQYSGRYLLGLNDRIIRGRPTPSYQMSRLKLTKPVLIFVLG